VVCMRCFAISRDQLTQAKVGKNPEFPIFIRLLLLRNHPPPLVCRLVLLCNHRLHFVAGVVHFHKGWGLVRPKEQPNEHHRDAIQGYTKDMRS
jgi:hypothetical protein